MTVMAQFFHLLFELYLFVYFIFAFQDLQNSVPRGPLFALCSGLWNTHLPAKDDTFKSVNKDILLLRKIYQLLVYNMFCPQFDSNEAPIPWTLWFYHLLLELQQFII